MSHTAQQNYIAKIKNQFPAYFNQSQVIEIGSLDINGSIREHFEHTIQYIGCDLGPGKGVDVVCLGHELDYPNGSFDLAISCECFEHDKHWALTFQKMIDLVRPGGLVVFTCASEGREEHGTHAAKPHDAPFTNNYYKNLVEQDFQTKFDIPALFREYEFLVNSESHDLYFWGLKKH
jgi:SAM-dependent methyltransferase